VPLCAIYRVGPTTIREGGLFTIQLTKGIVPFVDKNIPNTAFSFLYAILLLKNV